MRVVVVADKRGVGKVKPFTWGGHAGEAFWVDNQKFKITADNRLKLGKKFMDKHGFLRADGRRALILETGARYYTPHELSKEQIKGHAGKSKTGKYLVQGAEVLKGKPFEEWYEKKTGTRVPYKVGSEEDFDILKPFDGPDVYGGGL